MPKVTITGLAKRKVAKDHKKATPINKPGSKPKVAKANIKKPMK
jgi:hypothetical protein